MISAAFAPRLRAGSGTPLASKGTLAKGLDEFELGRDYSPFSGTFGEGLTLAEKRRRASGISQLHLYDSPKAGEAIISPGRVSFASIAADGAEAAPALAASGLGVSGMAAEADFPVSPVQNDLAASLVGNIAAASPPEDVMMDTTQGYGAILASSGINVSAPLNVYARFGRGGGCKGLHTGVGGGEKRQWKGQYFPHTIEK